MLTLYEAAGDAATRSAAPAPASFGPGAAAVRTLRYARNRRMHGPCVSLCGFLRGAGMPLALRQRRAQICSAQIRLPPRPF